MSIYKSPYTISPSSGGGDEGNCSSLNETVEVVGASVVFVVVNEDVVESINLGPIPAPTTVVFPLSLSCLASTGESDLSKAPARQIDEYRENTIFLNKSLF
jgi:hypothetical protein